MNLHLEPAWHRPLPELAALLTRGYHGYFVPITFTPTTLARTLRVHAIDLDTSQVAVLNGTPVGVALLSHRGWTTRLAAMAIVPESRGTGVGRQLLNHILAAGKVRGDRSWTLEVIEANTPAIRLYESVGFTIRRRLIGYRATTPHAVPSPDLEEIDVRDVAQVLLRDGPPDLPWQVTGEAVTQLGPPARGFRLGNAFAVLIPHDNLVELFSLIVPPASRRRGAATRLLQALFSLYPGHEWAAFARFPEDVPAALFTRLGFVEEEIRQKQMDLVFEAGERRQGM